MLTKHKYCPIPDDWDKEIKDCCWDDNEDDPKGDCCYETWQKQLDEVNSKYKEADETAKQLQRKLDSSIYLRDKLKTWYEDLTKAGDLSQAVCQQMEIFSSQIKNICCTTESSVKAIDLLYCMVKDFYIRLDTLKSEYDELVNCIKCLNDPDLNAGILGCLTAYAVKLDAAIATRDKLIELLVKAIRLAYEVNAAICSRYGLKTVISEWQKALNCAGSQSEGSQNQQRKEGDDDCDCKDDDCELTPMLSFPLKNDPYYTDLDTEKKQLDQQIDQMGTDLVEANKEKETLLANRENLIKAIAEVDPKNKCK